MRNIFKRKKINKRISSNFIVHICIRKSCNVSYIFIFFLNVCCSWRKLRRRMKHDPDTITLSSILSLTFFCCLISLAHSIFRRKLQLIFWYITNDIHIIIRYIRDWSEKRERERERNIISCAEWSSSLSTHLGIHNDDMQGWLAGWWMHRHFKVWNNKRKKQRTFTL